ncbi:hypothetical protein AURDEDRAFT_175325 [Auricularia subglabra TFB-10046 SS5]|nr:hypothetical protein AURDEDRAFT_175325 [Auricularia subglabra TFB-10046 SS5]
MLSTRAAFQLLIAASVALCAPQSTTQPNVTIEAPAPPGVTVANSAALCFFQCSVVPIDTSKCTLVDGTLDPNCGCKDETAQATIDVCLEKTCPSVKDEAAAYNKELCTVGFEKVFDSIGCVFDTCAPALADPIKAACGADADTKSECACTSPGVLTALDGCLSANTTCSGVADTARLTYNMFCHESPPPQVTFKLTRRKSALGGFNFTIHISGELDLNTTFTGTLGADKPAETGAPQGENGANGAQGESGGGNDGGNDAAVLSRSALAAALSVVAAVATLVV